MDGLAGRRVAGWGGEWMVWRASGRASGPGARGFANRTTSLRSLGARLVACDLLVIRIGWNNID